METKIWYSVQNGGDGSAYPQLMESKELCIIDQNWMGDECWGEPCYGWFTIESETPIKIKSTVTTALMVKKEIEEELDTDYMKKYKAEGKYPNWFKRLEGKLADVIALLG